MPPPQPSTGASDQRSTVHINGAAASSASPAAPLASAPAAASSSSSSAAARFASRRKAVDHFAMDDEPAETATIKIKKEEPARAPTSTASSSSAAAAAAPVKKEPVQEDETEVDRAWYDDSEEGGGLNEAESSAPFLGDEKRFAAKEEARAKEVVKKISQRAQQRNEDNNRWEENRLMTSGAVRNSMAAESNLEEDENRVQVMVHDLKPPFLDGRIVFTTQTAMVSVVRDPTSDLAVIAKQGSALLTECRAKSEKNKMKNKFWELAGSKIGKLMGVKPEPSDGDSGKVADAEDNAEMTDAAEGTVNYKTQSAFAKHLKSKTDAASAFSQEKTMRMQREYLPIFTCREQLMRVIADAPIVVIVGETGSGQCKHRAAR